MPPSLPTHFFNDHDESCECGKCGTRLSFTDGAMARSSYAWSPDDGKRYRPNDYRLSREGMLLSSRIWQPNFYSFNGSGFPAYSVTSDYYPADTETTLQKLQITLMENVPGIERLDLGRSTEGRPIYAFRFGKASNPHWTVTCAVHGNEIDGMQGTFKAVELICTEDFYAPMRELYTIFFVPAMNPDGWNHFTRNTRRVGLNGRTINLNRVWDWFWDDYTPSDFESKGDTPEEPPECNALLRYWKEGNAGRQVDFAMVIDQHSTRGNGHRYISRDRAWREASEDDFSYIWFDWLYYNAMSALQRRRVLDDGNPELYIRYFRSRLSPHLHPYFSTRQHPLNAISFVLEENKVLATDIDPGEDYDSANNYRLDYTCLAATLVSPEVFKGRKGVLVEGTPAKNILSNADWEQWQDGEDRPGFWAPTRAVTEKIRRNDRFLNVNGRGVKLTGKLAYDFQEGSPLVSVTAGGNNFDSFSFKLTDTVWYFQDNDSGTVFQGYASSSTLYGTMALPMPDRGSVAFAGGVTAIDDDGLPLGTLQSSIDEFTGLNGLAPSESVSLASLPAARMGGGTVSNAREEPTDANLRGYICGGVVGTGPFSVDGALLIWNPNTPSVSTEAFTVSARWGSALAYVTSGSKAGKIIIIGGFTNLGVALTDVIEWTPGVGVSTVSLSSVDPSWNGLGRAAAVYNPDDGLIYIYGGQETLTAGSGTDEFSYKVWIYDPVNLTLELMDPQPRANTSDAEDNDGFAADQEWNTPISGMAGISINIPNEENDIVFLIPGRKDDDEGSLETEIYSHDFSEEVIAKNQQSNYSFVSHNLSLYYEDHDEVLADEDFDGSGNTYTVESGSITQGSGYIESTGAALISWNRAQTKYPSRRYLHDIRLDSAGTLTSLKFFFRSTGGASPTDGYVLDLDGADLVTWTLYRRVSSADTQIAQGVSSQAVDTTERTLRVLVLRDNPVWVKVEFAGIEVLQVFDFSKDRFKINNEEYVSFQGNTAEIRFYDSKIYETLIGEASASSSMMVKAHPNNVSGYDRLTTNTRDDEVNSDSISRRVRNYYTIAPSAQYLWTFNSWFSRAYRLTKIENGFRQYMRVYKDDQPIELDAPFARIGSSKVSTWVPSNYTRTSEEFTYENKVALNALAVELDWLPMDTFQTIEEDTELLRIESDSSNYIRLVAKVVSKYDREYNQNDNHADHDPILRLEKVRLGSVVDSIECICYWSAQIRDTSSERYDLTHSVRVCNYSGDHMSLQIGNNLAESLEYADSDTDAFVDDVASIIIKDGGYWSEPVIRNCEISRTGRRFRRDRKVLRNREKSESPKGAILAGYRDPTNGLNDTRASFKIEENFTRADDFNLGSEWDILPGTQVGNGFDLNSNQARGEQQAFERWDQQPKVRNYSVEADVKVESNGSIVGLMARLESSDAIVNGHVYCYGCEIEQTAADTATLRIVTWYYDRQTLTNTKEVLSSVSIPSFESGVFRTLEFEVAEDDLIAYYDGVQVLSTTETLYFKAGRAGIYCDTPSSSDKVYIDRIKLNTTEPIFLED